MSAPHGRAQEGRMVLAKPDDKLPRWIPYALVAAALGFLSIFFLAAPIQRVLTVIPDDSAYYFKIAANAGAGRGLTFDGINRTNGFQPLWLYLLVPLYGTIHRSPETMYRIVLILQALLLAGAALLLNAALARFVSRRAALLGLVLYVFLVFVPAANGMESAILVLFLVTAFSVGWKARVFDGGGPAREFLFGMLLGLVVLSRLDMVFVPVAVIAAGLAEALFAPEKRRTLLARSILILTGTVLVVAPYLAYNRLSFGDIMPINGMLKSSFPHPSPSGFALRALGKKGWVSLLLCAAYLVWFASRSLAAGRRGRAPAGPDARRYGRAAMAVMACAILMHFVHTVLFMKWAVFSWHYIPYALIGAVIVCEPADRLKWEEGGRRLRVLYWILVAVIVAGGSAAVARNASQRLDRNWRPVAYAAAVWARENTPADAVFGMKDAGDFGYFSERSVINLDGVVNNLEYQAALRERSLAAYLAIHRVGYIVQHAFWDRPDILTGSYDSFSMSYRSRLYETDSDPIVLRKTDEVYRSQPYFDGPYETVFLIWKMGYDAKGARRGRAGSPR